MAKSGDKQSSGKQSSEISMSSRGILLTSVGVGAVVIALGFLSIDLYQRHNDNQHLAKATQTPADNIKPQNIKNVLPKLSPKTAQKPIADSKTAVKLASKPTPAKTETPKTEISKPEAPVAAVAPKTATPKPETTRVAVSQKTKPRFDIVRVEPDGTAVIAGRAAPGAEVEVMSGKTSIGKIKSNTRGEWVLVLKTPLKPGAHDLSIVSNEPNSQVKLHSQQKVAVAVPLRRDEKPLVVLSRKDKPSQVLQQPKQQAVPTGKLALKVVDYDNTGRIVFTGSATPGTTARIYVDNRFLHDAAVDEAGAWELRASAQIAPGNHKLRIDELDKIGKVTARIQLPFTRAQPVDVAAINKVRNALKAGSEKPKPAASPKMQMAAKPVVPAPKPDVTVAKETLKTEKIEPTAGKEPMKAPEAPAPSAMPKQAQTEPAPQQMPEKMAKSVPEPQQQVAAVSKPTMRGVPEQAPEVSEPKVSALKVPALEKAVAPLAPAEQKPQIQAANQPAASVQAPPSSPNGIVIQPGNNLWNISRVIYGEGAQYTVIYQANTDQIRDPDLIFPGQIFKTPGATPPRVISPDRREPLTK